MKIIIQNAIEGISQRVPRAERTKIVTAPMCIEGMAEMPPPFTAIGMPMF